MLKNNQFTSGSPIINSAKQIINPPHDTTLEVEKYINDFRLLEIRCSVLEEERTDYSQKITQSKTKQKAIEKTL